MTATVRSQADGLEGRRVGLFLLFAFGVAWATAAVLWATGGLTDSPTVFSAEGVSLSLASVLLPTAYMFAPAVANVATRALTGEGRADLFLSVGFFEHWRSYAVAWFAPAVLTVLGAGLFFAAFPRYFDPSMTAFAADVEAATGQSVDPTTVAVAQLAAAVTVAPLINAVPAFGEEFGWRGYLLPKLDALGRRRAVALHGLVWGVWHWPVIAMGYEYGFGYPGAPWTGLALFPVFTVAAGTVLAWLTFRSESVWPATVAHGAINAVAGLGIIFLRGDPNPLLGPLPVGLVGAIPWIVVAVWLLSRLATTGDAGGVAEDPGTTPGPER